MKNNIYIVYGSKPTRKFLLTYFDETDQIFLIFFLILIGSQILDSRAPL